jgi:iron complex outermembrane receptor protein
MPRKDNLSPTGNFALAKNIGKVITTGLEADIFYQSENLTAAWGLLWLNSNAGEENLSFYLSSHANFLSNINISYTRNKFFSSLSAVYKNRNPLEAPAIHANIEEHSFLMNLKAGVYLIRKELSVIAQVNNVFNSQTSDLLGAILPGRWVSAGIQWQIN